MKQLIGYGKLYDEFSVRRTWDNERSGTLRSAGGATGIIYSNTGGFKFPDGTIQITAAPTVGANPLSVVNNMAGGNYSGAPYSAILSGHNDSIYPSADFAVIMGGSNNSIRTQSLNIGGPIPANPNSHSFIGSGEFNSIRPNANHSAILGGRNNTVATGAVNSVILGGSNITATRANTVYMQNSTVTDLALSGSGYRTLMVDSLGNIVASRNPAPSGPLLGTIGNPWGTGGNDDGQASESEFLGTIGAYDLVMKTSSYERLRITKYGHVGIGTSPNTLPTINNSNPYKLDILGDVRILSGTGSTERNIVFKSGGGNEPKMGIGIEKPARALHVFTDHIADPNGPVDGLRLEDFYAPKVGKKVNSVWDIVPMAGNLVIGMGDAQNINSLTPAIAINSSGNVGIGTAAPNSTLDINGTINATNFLKGGNPVVFSQWTTAGNDIYYNGGNVGINLPATATPLAPLHVYGKVLIGKDLIGGVHAADVQLAVNGKIVSKSTYVTLDKWADFVFDNDYVPLPLEKVEEYYTSENRLPDYPSEKEIIDNGLDLGNIAMLQQKSIEEIMLYLVEMKKEVNTLKEKNAFLEKQLNVLKPDK